MSLKQLKDTLGFFSTSTDAGHGVQVIVEGREEQSDVFFHEYGRHVGMMRRSSLQEGK